MVGRLFLHLGAHKTASTHLQRCLELLSPQLRGESVAYAGPKQIRADAGLILRQATLQAKKQNPPFKVAEHLDDLAAGADVLLLSEENLLGHMRLRDDPAETAAIYPEADRRVRELALACPETPIDIFIAVREPTDFLYSSYAQDIRFRKVRPFDEFLHGLTPDAFRWSELIARLAAVPEVDHVYVWSYESYPAVFPALIDILSGGTLKGRRPAVTRRVYESLSKAAVEMALGEVAAGREAPPASLLTRKHPRQSPEDRFTYWDDATHEESKRRFQADIDLIQSYEDVTWVSPIDFKDDEGAQTISGLKYRVRLRICS
ncbi:MAG: hypothetical protein ACPGVK_08005 [Halocynthiibacter sp.]